jgi:colanic acid/amylovoran biosynthesis glycosyltransferase
MSHRPVLGHVFGSYLQLSQPFSYELIASLTSFEHRVFAWQSENLDRFPVDHLFTSKSPEDYWPIARRERVELVFAHFGPLGMTALPMALMNDLPAVTIFHGYDVSMLLREPYWVERYRTLAALGMHGLCISDVGRERLAAIGWPTTQLTTIHLGVDTQRFRYQPRNRIDRGPGSGSGSGSTTRLLIVARLIAKKGVDVAIRALDLIRAAGVNAELRVIGDGPERASLEALIAGLKLESFVTLAGAQSHAEVAAALGDADMLLQCSVTAPNGDQEGIPVVLMEAQASGVPVIATRHSGIPELVLDGRTGLLTDEHDVAGLANAITLLIREPAFAGQLARAGRARVEEEFDRTRQAGRFTEHLRALIARGPRRVSRSPSSARGLSRPTRLLFIHAAGFDTAMHKLMSLRVQHPGAHITVLTAESIVNTFRACPLIDDVRGYPDGPLRLRRLGRALLHELQQMNFDLVVTAYANDDGAGFGSVRRVARACGGRRRLALNSRDREIELIGSPRPRLYA